MASCLFPSFLSQLMSPGLDNSIVGVGTFITAYRCDIDAIAFTITDATNATPIVITTSTPHGMATGDVANIRDVSGNTAANGLFFVTVLSTTTFSLQDYIAGSDVAGNGSYVSGGRIIDMSCDFSVGFRGAAKNVGNLNQPTPTSLAGDDVIFTSATGDEFEAIVLTYQFNAVEINMAYMDTYNGSPFSIIPDGSDITIQWSDGINKIFRL